MPQWSPEETDFLSNVLGDALYFEELCTTAGITLFSLSYIRTMTQPSLPSPRKSLPTHQAIQATRPSTTSYIDLMLLPVE